MVGLELLGMVRVRSGLGTWRKRRLGETYGADVERNAIGGAYEGLNLDPGDVV
jgi:hypothetical protein